MTTETISATPATSKEIEVARAIHQDGDTEIDDNATVSRADGEGRWVSAWVWVSDDEMEDSQL